MNKKLLTIIGGTFLSAILMVGCATNNQNPPPPTNKNVETPGVNDNNLNDNLDRNNDLNNNNNDINTNNDGDMMRDNNTPGEDVIEDKLDRNDKDNRDR